MSSEAVNMLSFPLIMFILGLMLIVICRFLVNRLSNDQVAFILMSLKRVESFFQNIALRSLDGVSKHQFPKKRKNKKNS